MFPGLGERERGKARRSVWEMEGKMGGYRGGGFGFGFGASGSKHIAWAMARVFLGGIMNYMIYYEIFTFEKFERVLDDPEIWYELEDHRPFMRFFIPVNTIEISSHQNFTAVVSLSSKLQDIPHWTSYCMRHPSLGLRMRGNVFR